MPLTCIDSDRARDAINVDDDAEAGFLDSLANNNQSMQQLPIDRSEDEDEDEDQDLQLQDNVTSTAAGRETQGQASASTTALPQAPLVSDNAPITDASLNMLSPAQQTRGRGNGINRPPELDNRPAHPPGQNLPTVEFSQHGSRVTAPQMSAFELFEFSTPGHVISEPRLLDVNGKVKNHTALDCQRCLALTGFRWGDYRRQGREVIDHYKVRARTISTLRSRAQQEGKSVRQAKAMYPNSMAITWNMVESGIKMQCVRRLNELLPDLNRCANDWVARFICKSNLQYTKPKIIGTATTATAAATATATVDNGATPPSAPTNTTSASTTERGMRSLTNTSQY